MFLLLTEPFSSCGPQTVLDLEGKAHTLAIGPKTIVLDDLPAIIKDVSEHGLRFACDTDNGNEVACSTEALGRAILGGEPSVTDVGSQLAQNLARWSLEQQLTARLHTLQDAIQVLLEEYERLQAGLFLPHPRLDPFTHQVLQTYKGTPESAQVISIVLSRPLEQIRALLAPAAASMHQLARPPYDEQMPLVLQ
jgi:hypothetical protein